MADFSCISVIDLPPDRFFKDLQEAVLTTLGPPWHVRRGSSERGTPPFIVELPGTATSDPEEARQKHLPPGVALNFRVELWRTAIRFRHPFNMFANWAQGRVEEELADKYRRIAYHEESGDAYPPGTRRFRAYPTFREYLIHGQEGADPTWIESMRRIVPEGHW
jgi:hypothetical protein